MQASENAIQQNRQTASKQQCRNREKINSRFLRLDPGGEQPPPPVPRAHPRPSPLQHGAQPLPEKLHLPRAPVDQTNITVHSIIQGRHATDEVQKIAKLHVRVDSQGHASMATNVGRNSHYILRGTGWEWDGNLAVKYGMPVPVRRQYSGHPETHEVFRGYIFRI